MDLRQDGLEIAVPNDFISEWIGKNFTRPIQEAAHEVLGGPLPVRFCVVPELFEVEGAVGNAEGAGETGADQPKRANGKTASRMKGVEASAVVRSIAIVPGGARPATPAAASLVSPLMSSV